MINSHVNQMDRDNNMIDNTYKYDLIDQAIENAEALKETLFEMMKYHGSVDNIKQWNLFHIQDQLFNLQRQLNTYKSKQETRRKLYIV